MPRTVPRRPLPPRPAAATRQGDVAMTNNTAQDTPRRSPRFNSNTENNNNRRSPRLAAQREAAATAASATNDLADDFAADLDALPAAVPCCTTASRGGHHRGKTEYTRERSGVREWLDKPESKRPSDDEFFRMQRESLERLSKYDYCPSIKRKNTFHKCNCLTILRDEKICDAVAAYVLDFQKMDTVGRGQRVVDG